jgi:predicted amidophosphoribosyltransferase
VRDAAQAAASIVVPPRCALCRVPCPAREPLCEGCAAQVAASPGGWAPASGVDACWSAALLDGAPRALVGALKFRGRLGLVAIAAAAILRDAPDGLLRGDLVPVPADRGRRRRRGFDPAEALARALAAESGLALRACLRRGRGPRQVGRSRALRIADPPRIAVAEPAPLRAVLVDDVTTTGATLAACATVLRRSGTAEVVAVTFARTPPTSRPPARRSGVGASAAAP